MIIILVNVEYYRSAEVLRSETRAARLSLFFSLVITYRSITSMSKRRSNEAPQGYIHRRKARAVNLTTTTAPNGQRRIYAASSNVTVSVAPPPTPTYSPLPPPISESGQTDFWSENGHIPQNPDDAESLGIHISSTKRYQNSVSSFNATFFAITTSNLST